LHARTHTRFEWCTITDFLASLADSTFLFRDGIVSTDTFINSATQTVEVVFVFFTPGAGLITVLTVKADLTQDELLKARM